MTDEVLPETRAAIMALAAKPYARDLFGICLEHVSSGSVTLAIEHRPELGHLPGWFQGAVTTAIGEYAASWSAITLASAGCSMLTIQQSIHFVGPARGERLIAIGRVISSGKSIAIGAADIFAEVGAVRTLCAVLTLTNRCLPPR